MIISLGVIKQIFRLAKFNETKQFVTDLLHIETDLKEDFFDPVTFYPTPFALIHFLEAYTPCRNSRISNCDNLRLGKRGINEQTTISRLFDPG